MKTQPNYNLIAKYINKECTEKEHLEFENWLGESKENHELFNQIKEAWGAHGANPASISSNKKEAWADLYNNTISKDSAKTINLFLQIAKIAAALILLLGIAYLVKLKMETTPSIALVEQSTCINSKVSKVVLPDNSIVWLNRNTEIKYPEQFSDTVRRVILIGEAYFEVAKNPDKPFIIGAGNTETKVLGTSFNLKANKDDANVELIVNSGKVAFSSKTKKAQSLILTKGLAANYTKKEDKVVQIENYNRNYLSWKTGQLFFIKESLFEISKTLEEHYNINVKVGDGLKGLIISATYNNKKVEEVAEMISEALDINYKLNKDSLLFYK